MASVTRYTRFVALSKHFLWVVAAAVIALLVWVASDNSGENGTRIIFSNAQKTEKPPQNVMNHPHYQGVDAQNRPYTVIADTATQVDASHVALVAIRADMTMTTGAWLALNAGSGMLNLTAKQLELKDAVDMFYDGGYEFRTDHAHVDIQKGSAYGDAPVEGQGPLGTLKADSFSVENRGQVIRFNGSVRMTLYH